MDCKFPVDCLGQQAEVGGFLIWKIFVCYENDYLGLKLLDETQFTFPKAQDANINGTDLNK